MHRKTHLAIAALLVSGASLLAACGDDDDTVDTPATTEAPAGAEGTDDSMTDDSMTDDSMTDDSMTDDGG